MNVTEAIDKVFMEEFREQDRKAAGWLLHYVDIKERLEEKKEDMYDSTLQAMKISDEPKSRTNLTADQTGNTVVKLSNFKEEKQIRLIEDVMQVLPQEKRVFLQLRQKYRHVRGGRGNYGAYTKIQYEYAEKMAKLTGKDEEEVWKAEITLKKWWKEIIEITVRLALKRNLL